MKCDECGSQWEPDCEQAISIERNGVCFTCAMMTQKPLDIHSIMQEARHRQTQKWGIALAMVNSGSIGEYCIEAGL
jgi:hypothetical protein